MRRIAVLLAVLASVSLPSLAHAQEMPAPYKQVLDALGKTGDFKDDVLKVNIPRNDLSVTVANVIAIAVMGWYIWATHPALRHLTDRPPPPDAIRV